MAYVPSNEISKEKEFEMFMPMPNALIFIIMIFSSARLIQTEHFAYKS